MPKVTHTYELKVPFVVIVLLFILLIAMCSCGINTDEDLRTINKYQDWVVVDSMQVRYNYGAYYEDKTRYILQDPKDGDYVDVMIDPEYDKLINVGDTL